MRQKNEGNEEDNSEQMSYRENDKKDIVLD